MEAAKRTKSKTPTLPQPSPAPTRDNFIFEVPVQAPAWPRTPPLAPVNSFTKRQLSLEEWMALKPVIERLYIHENKTYEEVAKYLGRNHNFEPTYVQSCLFSLWTSSANELGRRRQFESRTKIWGLKKNTRLVDRKNILKKSESNDIGADGTVKVTPQKLKRWGKQILKPRKTGK